MNSSPRLRRTQSALSVSLQKRLNTYAIAAGAAGVSLLILGQWSEAEIVYTPANEVIGRNGSYSLDLNHDGIIDFVLVEHAVASTEFFHTSQRLNVKAANGNGVNCIVSSFCISTYIYAAAWEPGKEIGVSPLYGWIHYSAPMALEQLRKGSMFYYWPWANISDHYLGLKFKINGETHYGWARLTVKFHAGPPKDRAWEAHLTGYAYETIADKSIIAGKTKGNDHDDEEASGASFSPEPPELKQFAPLGTLALGARGLALWRRSEAETAAMSRDN